MHPSNCSISFFTFTQVLWLFCSRFGVALPSEAVIIKVKDMNVQKHLSMLSELSTEGFIAPWKICSGTLPEDEEVTIKNLVYQLSHNNFSCTCQTIFSYILI